MTSATAAVVAALLVSGCAAMREARFERDLERSRAAALAKIDQDACRAEGGRIEGVGMFATPACVLPFADAGKTCTDSDECEGVCKAADDAAPGTRAEGTCQVDTAALFGCYSEILDGIVVVGPCFD